MLEYKQSGWGQPPFAWHMMSVEPDWDALHEAPLTEWVPRTALVVERQRVPRSRFPCIDAHNHLGRWLNDGEWLFPDVGALIDVIDESNVELVVNLDGFWGDELSANIARYDQVHPTRIATFCWIEWARLARPDGVGLLKAQLDESARLGARGVKVWKELGLRVRDADGRLILPDDPRVVDVLGYAGELDLPVLIHIADPKAYFEPVIDMTNERLGELLDSHDLWVGDPGHYPGFYRLIDALEHLVAATPATRYVGAHVGCASEDLGRVAEALSRLPNFWVDFSGRVSEVGRQPRRFRELIERFPDRVVLGTDLYPATNEKFEKYFHFLESSDEGFDYEPREPYPPHARWTLSALGLSDELLKRVYRTNARAWLGTR